MNRNANLKEKYLDGEKLFRKYIEMGENRSVYLLCEYAIMKGMKSSTGQEPTVMGCWKAIWRWASIHKEEAWELVKNQTFGTSKKRFQYNKERWEKEMIEIRIPSAWQHTTHAKRDKFLKENGWI
jgi:hypothetical protein